MNTIPTKSELAANQAQSADAERQKKVAQQVTSFTNKITAAMSKGETYLPSQLDWPLPEAETQLKNNFAAKGWALEFSPARTGGTIRWS